jgi:hypothetical protein
MSAVRQMNETSYNSNFSQKFQVKYNGKYVDFIPYKNVYNLTNSKQIECYEHIPENAFGKIIIKEKNTITDLYTTIKKKKIKIIEK